MPGRRVVILCDTNGGTMPERIAEVVPAVKRELTCAVGIHTPQRLRPRRGQLARRRAAGATQVQGTMNGIGERCGNVDLVSVDCQPRAQVRLRRARSPTACRD